MTRHPIVRLDETLPADMLRHLEASAPAPAWLIDVGAGRMLAASWAGAAWLGITAGASDLPLDAASPALSRLRVLAAATNRKPHDADARETLLFWTPAGVVRAACRIRMLQTGPRAVAVVVAEGHHGPPITPPLFGGSDAAKLKEIARRIRNGQQTEARAAGRGPGASRAPSSTPTDTRPPFVGEAQHDTTRTADTVPPTLRARLAHELRTPIGALTAAAEIMKDERFGPLGSPRYVGYAADIHASAQHILRVIDRMLADARTGGQAAGAETFDFTEIDATALLASSVSQMAPLAERAGLTLALDLAPRLPHVVADTTSLRQILFNLMTNALKFTPRGGGVTVSAHPGDDGSLTITISDTGRGMGRREVEALLEQGRDGGLRTGRSSARDAPASDGEGTPGAETPPIAESDFGLGHGPGLGLGLPLVQALAAANGAALSIDSVPGAGTSASLTFRKDRVIPV